MLLSNFVAAELDDIFDQFKVAPELLGEVLPPDLVIDSFQNEDVLLGSQDLIFVVGLELINDLGNLGENGFSLRNHLLLGVVQLFVQVANLLSKLHLERAELSASDICLDLLGFGRVFGWLVSGVHCRSVSCKF